MKFEVITFATMKIDGVKCGGLLDVSEKTASHFITEDVSPSCILMMEGTGFSETSVHFSITSNITVA
jgi:hypothetical protein